MTASRLVTSLCIAVLMGALPSTSGQDAPIEVRLLDQSPKLDGTLDEPFWGAAAKVQLSKQITGDPASEKTEVRLARDRSYLYVGFICYESSMKALRRHQGGRFDIDVTAYSDDCVALHVDPGTEGQTYYHFAVSASRAKCDKKVVGRTEKILTWDSGFAAWPDVGKSAWTVEMAIPLYALEPRGGSGKPWRINLCRIIRSRKPHEYVSWASDIGGFHAPDPAKFIPVRGMEEFEIERVFEPVLKQPFISEWGFENGRNYYTVNVTVVNQGGKAGQVDVEVSDYIPRNRWLHNMGEVIGKSTETVRVPEGGPVERRIKILAERVGRRGAKVFLRPATRGKYAWGRLVRGLEPLTFIGVDKAAHKAYVPNAPALVDTPQEALSDYGAEGNPTGDPIGGGAGYSRIVEKGDYTVTNAEEFLAALEQGQAGQVVYVAPNSKIDLTGQILLKIPAGVTLAGDRGRDGSRGPLLLTDEMPKPAHRGLFIVGGNVRITGLRFRGPDAGIANIDYKKKPSSVARCIIVAGEDVEIDNCEISNFQRDGIGVRAKGTHVHHNFIHDVHAYPVCVSRNVEPLLVEASIIHWCWHAIAGTGETGCGYEARYNVFIGRKPPWGGIGHCLDMHPDRRIQRSPYRLRVAGERTILHHNTVKEMGGAVGVRIRGAPRHVAEVHSNWFSTTDPAQAVAIALGNQWVYDNVYGPAKQKLAQVSMQSTPRIHFKQPPMMTRDPLKVSGKLTLDIEVTVLDGLKLQGVLIELEPKPKQGEKPAESALLDRPLYLNPRSPSPSEVTINTQELPNGDYELVVKAMDNRDVIARQSVVITVGN